MKSNLNHPQHLAIHAEVNQVHSAKNRSRKIVGRVAYKIGSAIHWISYKLNPAQKRFLLLSLLVLLSGYFIFVLLHGTSLPANQIENNVKQALPVNPAIQVE